MAPSLLTASGLVLILPLWPALRLVSLLYKLEVRPPTDDALSPLLFPSWPSPPIPFVPNFPYPMHCPLGMRAARSGLCPASPCGVVDPNWIMIPAVPMLIRFS